MLRSTLHVGCISLLCKSAGDWSSSVYTRRNDTLWVRDTGHVSTTPTGPLSLHRGQGETHRRPDEELRLIMFTFVHFCEAHNVYFCTFYFRKLFGNFMAFVISFLVGFI